MIWTAHQSGVQSETYPTAPVSTSRGGPAPPTISIPTHIAGYRERGVLKRYRSASLGIWVIAGSELIVAFALSAASSVILLVAARLVYDFDSPASLLGVIAVFCYLTLGLAAMGLLLGGLVSTARAAQGARPADLVRDVDGRRRRAACEVLTGAMRYVSDATPLRYAVRMMHQPWLDPGASWWVFTGVAVTSGGIAILLFRWE